MRCLRQLATLRSEWEGVYSLFCGRAGPDLFYQKAYRLDDYVQQQIDGLINKVDCIMGDFVKKCCQCYWFSTCACNVASCIDQWHSVEACGLASLYCNACCWTLCSPLCIDCKCGDTGPALDNCTKGIKYCLFSCALCIAACIDGCYNCVKVIQLACGQGVKSYADLTKNAEHFGNKVKESLGLETGNEPLRSMDTFKP